VTFFDDAGDAKSDRVDGAIGELSLFHETYGYYAQGVSVSTATLPAGWRERVIIVETESTAPGRGHCLEPHDGTSGRPRPAACLDEPSSRNLSDAAPPSAWAPFIRPSRGGRSNFRGYRGIPCPVKAR
jgi:hypothetical protein